MRGQLAAATMRATAPETRVIEIEKRAVDLKDAGHAALEPVKAIAAELADLRRRHDDDAARLNTALAELATVKSQFAEHRQHAAEEAKRTADQLELASAERDAAIHGAADAKEAAALLRGQLDPTVGAERDAPGNT